MKGRGGCVKREGRREREREIVIEREKVREMVRW
jgi:hypothetical protein